MKSTYYSVTRKTKRRCAVNQDYKEMMQPGFYAFGAIASLQNDENGNPTWIVSGIWKGSLSMGNETQGVGSYQTNSSSAANTTSTTGGAPNATLICI